MDSIRKAVTEILLDETKLQSLTWLLSFSFLATSLLTFLLSFFMRTGTKALVRFYFIRGVLFLRLISYGCLLAVSAKFWTHHGRSLLFAITPGVVPSMAEAVAFCVFYYAVMVLYEYDQVLLGAIVIEGIMKTLGERYVAVEVLYVLAVLAAVVAVGRSDKRRVYGKFMWLIQAGILLPALAVGFRIYFTLTFVSN